MLEMMMTYVRSALAREEGQGLVEYALILSLVSVVAIAGLTLLGTNVNTLLTNIAGQV
jgi:pilus assembly protein Flp/PilA